MFENDSTTEGTTATVERSEEFETFRALVRRKALAARDSMGWDAPSLNKTLITLGLEPTDVFAVTLKVSGTATYRREYGTGTARRELSREEALSRVVAMSDNQLRENISWDAWEFTERPEPVIVQVGVDDAEPDPVALGNDLDAYKKLVRRVGIAVAKERGWCDSGTNEYLEALGLGRIQRFRIPVQATVVQTYMHEAVEAESLEEARRLVAEQQITLDAVRANLGRSIREVQAVAPVDMNSLQVGDPEVTEAYERHCNDRSPDNANRCLREHNHDGQHISFTNSRVSAVWPGAEVPVPA